MGTHAKGFTYIFTSQKHMHTPLHKHKTQWHALACTHSRVRGLDLPLKQDDNLCACYSVHFRGAHVFNRKTVGLVSIHQCAHEQFIIIKGWISCYLYEAIQDLYVYLLMRRKTVYHIMVPHIFEVYNFVDCHENWKISWHYSKNVFLRNNWDCQSTKNCVPWNLGPYTHGMDIPPKSDCS